MGAFTSARPGIGIVLAFHDEVAVVAMLFVVLGFGGHPIGKGMEKTMKNFVKWLRGGDGGPSLPKPKGAVRKSVVCAGLAMMAMMVLMQALSWAQDKKEEPKPAAPAAAPAAAPVEMSKD